MTETRIQVSGYNIPVYRLNTVVVGTGAAGYNAADRLCAYGQRDVAMVTEGVNTGTSRNTGSDKQTYYKLTLSGGEPDSVREMAETLFSGQCVDGDTALCEAALSAPSFLRLAELGVPFPKNRYGEYIGYKTDHDPRRRATSVGPYTSRTMTECLQASVEAKGIRIFDKMQVIRVLSNGRKTMGLLCLDMTGENEPRYALFNCTNIVYATGGPAGMYADSVYPEGHYGATGLAFEARALGKNLTEWQYGLASTAPRWNVSGTYMQVLPRFISTDVNGGGELEFLPNFFDDRGDMLTKVFLKGYQWPFDVGKIDGGSSIIDILVYIESGKGRRVFLDFRQNPCEEEVDYASLSDEAREYLETAGACFGTPIERLLHMNAPAVDFYLDKGVDLKTEPLEIALCAQHNNGGIGVDCWWQSNLEGFFAVGECAASHGVYRPGGSALNAGQVGATRAAQYIATKRQSAPPENAAFAHTVIPFVEETLAFGNAAIQPDGDTAKARWEAARRRMSRVGGAIRSTAEIRRAAEEVRGELAVFAAEVKVENPRGLALAYRLWDVLISQQVYLSAMANYAEQGGKSRGSALYSDKNGKKPYSKLPDVFTFSLSDGSFKQKTQEVLYKNGQCHFSWRDVRPIPEDDSFFENVWRQYRENGNIY
jgi:succinate dehydrogenase/fumarate reductase flavoprotein subunit